MALNDGFRRRFKQRIEKSKDKTELFFKKLTTQISAEIIQMTPVDKGQLHWNWFVGNGLINGNTEPHTGNDKGSASSRNESLINSINVNGQIIYVTNALPYAHRIEYEGWSRQAPAGMVRVTLARMNAISRGVALEVKRL